MQPTLSPSSPAFFAPVFFRNSPGFSPQSLRACCFFLLVVVPFLSFECGTGPGSFSSFCPVPCFLRRPQAGSPLISLDHPFFEGGMSLRRLSFPFPCRGPYSEQVRFPRRNSHLSGGVFSPTPALKALTPYSLSRLVTRWFGFESYFIPISHFDAVPLFPKI